MIPSHQKPACTECDGEGALTVASNDPNERERLAQCEACRGSGSGPCELCQDEGEIECTICRGDDTGRRCQVCRGDGVIKCQCASWTDGDAVILAALLDGRSF